MKGKHLLFLEEKEIFFWHNGEKATFPLETFVQNPPKGKAELLIADERVQKKIVTLPVGKKLKLHQVMEYEALELVEAANPEELRSEFIFNWRLLGEEEGQKFFLLLVLPREEIIPFLETCRPKGLEIENIICSLDLLIKIGEKYSQREEEFFLFAHKTTVYLIAFKHKKYIFHRKFELTQTEESGLREEFLLELKRSIFYAKQKYKLTPDTLTVLFLPSFLAKALKETEIELGLKEVKFLEREKPAELEAQQIPPFFNFWLAYYHLTSELISLLPPEILLEKRLKNWALVTAGIGLLFFLLSFFYVFKYAQEYETQIDHLSTTLNQTIKLKKQLILNRSELAHLHVIQRQVKLLKPLLERRHFSYIYLEALPYLLPSKVHLERLCWEVGTSTAVQLSHQKTTLPSQKRLIIEGKVEVKDPQRRNQVFQSFIDNLKNCPLIVNIPQEKTNLLFKQGLFRLTLDLREIKP